MKEKRKEAILKREFEPIEQQGNYIFLSFEGIQISSSRESIQTLVKIIDYLIEKHKDFILGLKKNNTLNSLGMLGVG